MLRGSGIVAGLTGIKWLSVTAYIGQCGRHSAGQVSHGLTATMRTAVTECSSWLARMCPRACLSSRCRRHSWSSCAYAEAEQLFREQTSWSWLGVFYQEQAICLFQSIPAGVRLVAPPLDPAEHAESLIVQSLELCRDLNARSYPSALNRAGRIFGAKHPDRGLSFLAEAAGRAQGLSDGWFWLASLVEYVELCYRTWSETGERRYIEQIPAIASQLAKPEAAELEFPELRGRWYVLQGHLAMHEVLAGNENALAIALENYRIGFPLITHGWVGSYGASAIPGEFRKFSDLVWQLPAQTRAHWRQELRESWSGHEESATQLLARLEELY